MSNLVEIRDLRIGARTDSGREVQIIKGVSIDVAAGEIVALIGESGSGKTTIALSLMGHVRPGCYFQGGSVTVAGRDMAALRESERAKLRGTDVAYVPQSAAAAFNPAHRLMDQVIEATLLHGLMSRPEAEAAPRSCRRGSSLPPIHVGGLTSAASIIAWNAGRRSSVAVLPGSTYSATTSQPLASQ